MGSFSDYWENEILDHLFGKGSYSPPTIWVALSTAEPGETGTGLIEPSGDGYARAVTSPADWSVASSGTLANADAIELSEASAAWGTVTHFALFDAATGGNLSSGRAPGRKPGDGPGDAARFAWGSATIWTDCGFRSAECGSAYPVRESAIRNHQSAIVRRCTMAVANHEIQVTWSSSNSASVSGSATAASDAMSFSASAFDAWSRSRPTTTAHPPAATRWTSTRCSVAATPTARAATNSPTMTATGSSRVRLDTYSDDPAVATVTIPVAKSVKIFARNNASSNSVTVSACLNEKTA